MKPIIVKTLKDYRLRLACFSIAISLYILLVTAVFRNYLTANNGLAKSVQQLPDALRSFISIKGDFLSPAGFLGSEPYYVVLPIVFIILAIGIGGTLLARDEDNHTLELLLARPISRSRLLAAKVIGGVLVILAVNLISLFTMIIFTRAFNIHIGLSRLAEVHFLLFLLSLIFGSLALALTSVGRVVKSAAFGISALLAIGGYILASLEQQVGWLRWPARLLPYHYYDPSDILSGTFAWSAAIGFIIVVIILASISWLAFRRRDIA